MKSTSSHVVSWCLSILDIEDENKKSKQQPYISLIYLHVSLYNMLHAKIKEKMIYEFNFKILLTAFIYILFYFPLVFSQEVFAEMIRSFILITSCYKLVKKSLGINCAGNETSQ